MKNPLILSLLLLLCYVSFAQPGNDACSNATTLFPGLTCSNMAGNLRNAATTNVSSGCGSRADVWYRFTVPVNSTSVTVTVTITSGTPSINTTNTFIERLNANSCPSTGTSVGGCNSIASPVTYSGLTPGATYLFRIYTTVATNGPSNTYNFNVCITTPPNTCSEAMAIVPGTTLDHSLRSNFTTASTPLDCSGGSTDDAIWYKFTAVYPYATIALHNIGSNFLSSGPRLQLFSGSCGSMTSIACGTTTINATGLIPGDQYYYKVYAAGTGQTGSNWGFRVSLTPSAPLQVTAGRLKEVYNQQIISAPQLLADPWEVTYGPDDQLWITEAKGYRVFKVNPVTGVRDTVLDISRGSSFLPLADTIFNCKFANGAGAQGGCAGLALHPKFLDAGDPKNYVYLAYVYSQINTYGFINRIVRFTYNTSTGRLESPVSVCDTLPGGQDHNSQRMIIAPVGDKHYLFYASGDMGAGQFKNRDSANNAQVLQSYEGKILRFNLEPDGDVDSAASWIPSTGTGDDTNPFNDTLGVQSAVWSVGMRNNQGFAYDTALKKLYGSSHGPFSDDEINVIERAKNYGHPLVIGYAADANVNGTTAGAGPLMADPHPSSVPVINDEVGNAAAIGPSYKDPLFSAYPNSPVFPSINTLWNTTTGGNGSWPSEGWSGLDLYTHTLIPGWYKSLVAASLKWGRLVRLRLDSAGSATAPTNTASDTVSYFGSINRFRDLAFSPNGRDIYVLMDRSSSTSGPSAANPIIPGCGGCIQKYSFLGYADEAGKSSISSSINVTEGVTNTCNAGTTITIDDTNNNLWVPITGPDGNIMAEINANGQNLGTVTSSFYKHMGPIRSRGFAGYLDRNITITPQTQPSGNVKVRFYFTKAEYDLLDADPLGQVTSISDLKIYKNTDPCSNKITAFSAMINPVFSEAHGASGYMLQAEISSFSSFYFGASSSALPVRLVSFTGVYRNEISYLSWKTQNEGNTDYFVVERSIGNSAYEAIGTVFAKGGQDQKTNYSFDDTKAGSLGVDKIYYRLRIADKDGSFTYSDVVLINIAANMATNVSVYPNPVDEQAVVQITTPKEQRIYWQLVDMSGRIVISKEAMMRKGDNRIILDLSGLNGGVYFLQVNGPSVNSLQKIQKR